MTTTISAEDTLRETIQKDLASFADPRTTVEVTDREAHWVQRRQARTILFLAPLSQSEVPPRLRYDGTEYDYAAFFASEWMADLRGLAEAIPHELEASPNFVRSGYVDGSAAAVEDGAAVAEKAGELMTRLGAPADGQTRSKLVFLQGRAGDGKSSLLTHLAHAHALRYLRGETTWLFFYIDAQGQALARLNQAIATVLQDLRASFTYHGLSTLTRLGLVVPVVDGFDELLSSGGYDDAFASLEAFVRQLDGRGVLVASARSTFYKYTGRAAGGRVAGGREGLAVETEPVFLQPWGDRESGEYLWQRGLGTQLAAATPVEAAEKARKLLGAAADEVLSSPFLLTQFADEVAAGRLTDVDHDRFLHGVIRSFITRELTGKILNTHGDPILREDGHVRLLGALAEEMWIQETRELDQESFRTICEMVCDDLGLDPSAAKLLLERMPSHAVLTRTNRPVRVAFRHELYYGYFFAEYLERAVRRRDEVESLLARSKVSAPIAAEFAAFVRPADVPKVVETLGSLRGGASVQELLAANAGTLAAAVVRRHPAACTGVEFRGMTFDAVDLSGTALNDASFTRCTFVRADLQGTKWENVRFTNTTLIRPVLSEDTVLGVTGLRLPEGVAGVVVRRGRKDDEEYNPARVRELLVARGVVQETPPPPPLTRDQQELVNKMHDFLNCVKHTTYFTEDDFLRKGRPLSQYDGFMRLAQQAGVLEASSRGARGTKTFYRLLVDPDDLKAGESGAVTNDRIRAFWDRALGA
ncbi:pentapeptide repeat-containing protein [Urbifossiella limnaea]|uniref:NACHT domain protein n=1 Tax=Urbifossiella limnaea TaxID=2528023 RepID=A0A517Y2W9_9BACT|nr:pentapeptide repeat-containing protein [Urbifossiella limnaea]QDU24014.1 NACHT domain protein [Urbifossiella limnaea]